jgi:uncharacterized protein (DUF1684 family)
VDLSGQCRFPGFGSEETVKAGPIPLILLAALAWRPATLDDAYVREVEAWRATHEADYRRDYVTIAGLFPLNAGPNTAGSAAGTDIVLPSTVPPRIGRFVLEGEQVSFVPLPGAGVRLDGRPVAQPILLRADARPPTELVVDEVRLVVHVSGERRFIRVRDPNGEQARSFAGFSWFPIDTAYRVTGRLIRDAAPRSMSVVNTVGDLATFTTEGVVEFALAGRTLRLRPYTTRPNRFYFVFRDASSGEETYETARFLYSDLLPDGTTVLDFNQAYNPPCAFNPYTTCPIPLEENRLPVKILAGERDYQGMHPTSR